MRRVEQRPVMGLDHPDARAHDPRELIDRERGRSAFEANVERRSYNRAGFSIPDDSTRRVPLAASKVVNVERATLGTGEDEGRVETGDQRVEGNESCGGQRYLTPRSLRLRAAHGQYAPGSVDVPTLDVAHSEGRRPVAAAKVIAAAPRRIELLARVLSAPRVRRRELCGEEAAGFLPASFAGFCVM